MRLAQALGRLSDAEVTITARVDPAILGGVVATVGSVVYDGSVAGQLERLKKRSLASGDRIYLTWKKEDAICLPLTAREPRESLT